MARRRRDGIAATRSFLYTLARFLGDVQAMKKGCEAPFLVWAKQLHGDAQEAPALAVNLA